jgi:hypothetical protein
MSWEDIRRRVLPPIGCVLPHDTSVFGATNRPARSTNPHKGADFNYDLGPGGQKGINLTNPKLYSPVAGIVTNAGQGTVGRIAVRDTNGYSHEILHTHTRDVKVGDRVAEGQLIGTMGNTGVLNANVEDGPQHVHYQLKDAAGNVINPTEFWDRQSPSAAAPSDASTPSDAAANIRRLGRRIADRSSASPSDENPPGLPSAADNDVLSADQSNSFDDRFGNWTSSPAGSAPLTPPQPVTPPTQFVLPDQQNPHGGLAGWIAALAGIDPENPNQPAPSLFDDPRGGFKEDDSLQPWFARTPIRSLR